MSFLQRNTTTVAQANMQSQRKQCLYERWFTLARILWLILVACTLSMFLLGIFNYFLYYSVSSGSIHGGLPHLDTSINGYIWFNLQLFYILAGPTTLNIVLAAISSLVWIAVGGVVFWRSWGKSEKWIARFVSLTLVLFGVNFSPFLTLMAVHVGMHSPWRLLITCIQVLSYILMGFFFCLFPDGHFVPRRVYWLPFFNVVYQVFFIVPTGSSLSVVHWPPLVFAFVEVSFILAFMFAQLYRYRLVSGSIARQQTKWVVYGMAIVMLAYTFLILLMLFFPSLTQTDSSSFLFESVGEALLPIVMFPIPITIGIAMLRYRLWDVDVLINRTLVYGTLTVLLALIYFGCVVLLQQLFQTVTGQGSPLAIVGSTLLIVVLFQPLRQRIQTALDRRFYRRKYDAARIITAFGIRLQEKGDLDMTTLTNDLVAVVEETMQPTHVSLWVCDFQHSSRRATRRLPVSNDE